MKRMIISVTFREKDKALYEFVLKKGDVIGNANYIKSLTLLKEFEILQF